MEKEKWLNVKRTLTETEIKDIAVDLGVTLPEDYVKLIGNINGGALINAYICLKSGSEITYERNLSLEKNNYGFIENMDKRLFPFGIVGNGDYFCFDLVSKCVVLWFHETGEDIYICESFSDLMELIITDDSSV